MQHNIVIFNGSARQGQYTEHVTNFVNSIAETHDDITTTIVHPHNYDFALTNEGQSASPQELTDLVTAADAYIVVMPEYNHGYPGSLKYMLDLNLKQYIHKPVAFVGVSSGRLGGVRAIENILPVVRELGMVATFTDVHFGNVQKEIEDGVVQNPEDWQPRVEKMLTELLWMSQTLKHGRENIPSQYSE